MSEGAPWIVDNLPKLGEMPVKAREYDRLRRIEQAAREYLIASGIQDDLYHETSISDAARKAACNNYLVRKEALKSALESV